MRADAPLLDEASNHTKRVVQRAIGLVEHKPIRATHQHRHGAALVLHARDLHELAIAAGANALKTRAITAAAAAATARTNRSNSSHGGEAAHASAHPHARHLPPQRGVLRPAALPRGGLSRGRWLVHRHAGRHHAPAAHRKLRAGAGALAEGPPPPAVINPLQACADDNDFAPLADTVTTQAPQHRWNAPVFRATNIRTDPRYKGGLIGFAMFRGQDQCNQAKFSQAELNTKSPEMPPTNGAPWSTGLIYQSVQEPTGYYIAC